MNIEQIFNQRKDDAMFNTSYPLKPADWNKWKTSQSLPFDDDTDISFYIHIPFCNSLCGFCEYVKFIKTNEEVEQKYLKIVEHDIRAFVNNTSDKILRGFDIGGGTPTILSEKNFMNLITMVNQYSELIKKSTDCSGSIEATFESLTIEKIKTISECSPLIKRISFGLQNVNSSFLKNNNRSNGPFKTMALLFNECRRRNIPVLNIDLMYGFMNQSEADMRATMTVVKELAPEHLTVYELRTNMLHNYQTASQKQRYRQYSYLYGLITDLGYKGRYGQNTFSKIDDFGVSPYLYHRMVENGSYKGFGISAQSKSIKGLSYNIGKNGESLIECCKRGTFENGDTYLLPPREMLSKYLAICGYCGFFDLNIMENIIHSDPMIEFNSVFEFLINNDLVSIDDRKVFISNKGFMNYGAILSLFFDNLSNIPLE